ncbi:MAG: CPBP family intramembrane metalloprotease [Pirellulales bacterium]|nr:CPBP family intramembrane metalloprotease [Pirellulales bacterium]
MKRLRPSLLPVIDAFRGDQLKPTIVLSTSVLLMLTWKYFGSPETYRDHLASWLPAGANEAAGAAAYSFVAAFLLLGVVPVLIVKLAFRERLADYGVQGGDRRGTILSFLILAPCFMLVAYLSSGDPAIRAEYPVNRSAGLSPPMFAFHACTYALYYLGWEFHFRGFLQFGLRGKLGDVNALWVQVMASSLLHIGKPSMETFGAIAGGVLWGALAYRTRSLLSGLLQHFLLGITLDWCICYL